MSEIKQGTAYEHLGNQRILVKIVCPWCACVHKVWVSPWELFGWGVGSRLMRCESDECEACERQFAYNFGITAHSTRIERVEPTADELAEKAAEGMVKTGVVIVEQDQEQPAKTKWEDA